MYALEHFDEIDEDYRRKQKRKLGLFIASAMLMVVSAIFGLITGQAASQMATDRFQSLMDEAAKETNDTKKAALYEEAIGVPDKAGEKSAYLELIKLFKADNTFTTDEQSTLVSLIKNNQTVLKENADDYVEICFETAKLFWYYYDYGDGSDNQVTRMKSSIEWFQDVIRNAPEDYVNLGMAQVYSSIGEFYRDIAINTVEASDRGLYQPFFVKISELMEQVCEDDTESEIVVLELLELVRSALQQYATKFKTDGVTWEEIAALYDRVAQEVISIETQTDKTTEKKNQTIALLDDTRRAIAIAYGMEFEEDK